MRKAEVLKLVLDATSKLNLRRPVSKRAANAVLTAFIDSAGDALSTRGKFFYPGLGSFTFGVRGACGKCGRCGRRLACLYFLVVVFLWW